MLKVNGIEREVDAPPDRPLLWILRDTLGLKGTKYGCGVGICGTCTVLIDGEANHACMVSSARALGREVLTVEGLVQQSHPLLASWIAEQVPQCGYCQPGQIMAAAALLHAHPRPTRDEMDHAMSGVLCRCGTYQRIRRAIERTASVGAVEPVLSTQAHLPLVEAGSDRRHCVPPGETVLVDERGRFAPNPWVRIARDGTLSVVIDRSEMGQGIVTGLAMLVAEELEVDLERLRIEFAPVDPAYANPVFGEQLTGGSTSIRGAWEPLRRAGAAAREMLIAAAAEAWHVRRNTCHAEQGKVIHAASGRSMDYGALVETAARQPVPDKPELKIPGRWRLLGRTTQRVELPDMVAGRTIYGLDISVCDCLYAVVLRCPVFGGKVAGFDARAALAVPGVRQVLEIGTGVAVVADSFDAACGGREVLHVDWHEGANAALNLDVIHHELAQAAQRSGWVKREQGDANTALNKATAVIEAHYSTPYLAHATLEPMNCTARVRADGCDVWVGTQAQQGARETAARESGLPSEMVRIHTLHLGGGFGRRGDQDFVAEAVQIAKAAGMPVKLVWTRDDDLRHDRYRPANLNVMRAAIRRGKPLAWLQRVVGPELALDGVDVPYAIPNLRIEFVKCKTGVPTGPWRSVGASQNAFAIECFIDELAHAAAADPLAWRLALLAHSPRHQRVLRLAAEKAGWGDTLPPGRGRGVAVYHAFGTWVAQVAEVSVGTDAGIRVHRVACAVDCGTVINPDAVAAQMEGGIALGLSAALHEEIGIERGRVVQKNLEDYPILSFREMPEVEVHIVASSEPPGGVGEPGVPPIAPAVANAVFAATGQRLRALPLRLGIRAG